MSNDNRISATLADTVKDEILTHLAAARDLMTFLVNLTPDERKRIPTIGTERTGMVAAFIASMNAHPELVPSYVNMTEVLKDRDFREAMLEIFNATGELYEAEGDTLKLAGSDLYTAFLAYYANAQQAAKRNFVGADTIVDDLKRFFPRGRSGPPTPPPGTP